MRTIGARLRRRVVAAIGLGGAVALCVAAATAIAASHTVAVVDFAFEPAELTIVAGDDVRWENQSSREHTVTADDGSFDSGPFVSDEPFSTVFETAGTFSYHCAIHPEMTGTIVVEEAAPTPVPSGPPSPTPPAGTLPPNFSPGPSTGPSESSQPPTVQPSIEPSPSPDASADGTGGLAPPLVLGIFAVVALVAASALLLRRRRGQP